MPNQIWKRNPPCEAHKLLVSMFEKKEVTPKTSAAALHKSNEEFLKYSLSVFRNVFTQLKNKHGVSRKLKLHF